MTTNSFGPAYDRYQNKQASIVDLLLVAKFYIDKFKAEYPEFKDDPMLRYNIGVQIMDEARPAVIDFLKEKAKQREKEKGEIEL